ncbi:hypothetical protein [Psychrobacillus vulpis]|uniref:Uncharacterized protein n=1 Tax=Psychrobacillus vulpis TaxID=2325572 RepID=A0A544TJT6_9BACI|nr:hypothetical protein [Psychrobacillus vulpis]TQR17703.1 hypothetical protein FG384_17435 [Psychrobacillus vulpis]
MIHTFKLRLSLEEKHLQYLQDIHGIGIYEVGRTFGTTFKGLTISVVNVPYRNDLNAHIFVDVTEVLDKGDITVRDLPTIEAYLRDIVETVFGERALYDNHILMRFDYRFDVIILGELKRLDYIKLFGKSMRQIGKRHKKQGYHNIYGFFEDYQTGLIHTNDSIETIIYDKVAERKKKNKVIASYEKDVVRFEVRLKEDHLNYQFRITGLLKTLDNYFNDASFNYYVEKYLLKTYLTEDFYKFSKAINQIEKSNLSIICKKSLTKFLTIVSRGDLTSPQRSMARSTFNRRLLECKQLKVHPTTIPNTWKHAPNVMENPLAALAEYVNNYKKNNKIY